MQRPNPETITLDNILITETLVQRPPRPADLQAENQAMRSLVHQLALDSETLLQTLTEVALELCQAGTAGVSLLETIDQEKVFRWSKLAGRFTHDDLIPRDFSPCGICVDRGTPQLFSHPEQYFTYLQGEIPIVEALLLPLIADEQAIGAIWIMSHDEARHFDSEDVRLMTSLADFTATALLLNQQQTGELLAANVRLETEIAERRQTEAQLSEAQRRLELSLAGADLGTWTYNIGTDEFWADDRALQLHGHEPNEVHTFAQAGANLHPEDRDRAQATLTQAIQSRSKLQMEYRVIWRDGSVHWIASSAEFVPIVDRNDGMFYGVAQDITEAKRDEADRKQTEAAAAADLEDTQRLRDLSARLVIEDDIQTLYQAIVATAIALTRADAGSIQILDEATQDLVLLATQGFEQNLIDHFHRVNATSNTPCGIALVAGGSFGVARSAKRTFVDFDVPGHEDPDGSMRTHREAGYRSAQSTPLITRSGKAIGMVSTHWCNPHRPTDRELRFLDLLARQAADLIEQRQAEAALRESEAHFRALIKASSDNVYRMSADWSVMHNLNGKQFITSTLDPKRTWLDEYIPADEQPQVWAAIESAIQTKSNFELEHRVFREDGTIGWTFSRAIPLLNQQGEIIEWFGAASDITDRKQAEVALRESEVKYRSLFESIDEGFCIFEMIYDETGKAVDYRFLEVNQAFERQTGLANAAGKLGSEIVPNTESYWLETYDNVIKTGEPQRIENYSQSTKRWYQAYTSRVGSVGSRQVCIVFNDITDRKKAEAALQESEERQAYLLRLSDVLRPLSDPIKIQQQALNIVGEYLDLDRVLYNEIDPDVTTYTVYINYVREGFPSHIGSYPMRPFAESVKNLRLGKTYVIYDAENEEQFNEEERAVCRGINVQAFVVVPLIKQGQWVVNVVAHYSKARNWTQYDVSILEETAERTWAAVERARAEESLRESEIQRVREQSAREQERQRAEALAELDRAKTIFFSNVSHEFRTPLTLMLAPLQDALSDRTLPPVHRESLELAHRNSLRLLKLVNTLLDFSRIEAGRMEAVYEPTDLSPFTAELASVFRSAIERAGLRLIVDCPPLPEPVFVDREMWEKIVLNLLSNAFKFTFEGEITVSLRAESRAEPQASTSNVHGLTSDLQASSTALEISASALNPPSLELETSASALETSPPTPDPSSSQPETSPGSPAPLHVILEIRDTGTGIAPQHLPHLFERFYQVRGTQARTYEGSGIGLALVHELVQLQGGTLDVSSTVGQGTCFTIALSFGTDHLPSDRLHRVVDDRNQAAMRRLASTAIGAAAYAEQVESWLPGDSPQLLLEKGENAAQVPSLEGENAIKVPPLFESGKSQVEELGGSAGLTVEPTFSPALVLLVDDNADVREYLTRILSEYVQVEAVADGAAALAAIAARVPDLILSDVMMPRLDGFGLLQTLRADPRTREVPIILLSARAGEEAIVEGLEAGADDYLIKPFSAQELVSRVNAHLQTAHLRSKALHEARTIIRSRDELLSTVSHELNTPLVSILGWTRLLRTNPPNPAILAKALDTIERNATLQANLVQDLLDVSRITGGKLRLNLQPVALETVIETAIATVTQAAANKGIHLTWQENSTEPVVVLGDSDRLQQVVCNLLTNAIKFTPKGGSVEVGLVEEQGNRGVGEPGSTDNEPSTHRLIRPSTQSLPYAQITVTDNGIGIAADFLPHVFDRFQQARAADAAKGLGLGLAIARHIVELHNGTIDAESAGAGQGATFIVRLPLPEAANLKTE